MRWDGRFMSHNLLQLGFKRGVEMIMALKLPWHGYLLALRCSVRGSYLSLFVKTLGMTQTPQECNLSLISITNGFNGEWTLFPLFQTILWRHSSKCYFSIKCLQLWLAKFWNKPEKLILCGTKEEFAIDRSRAVKGARWKMEQVKVKYLIRTFISTAIIKSTTPSSGGCNHRHISTIKRLQAELPYFYKIIG